MVLVADAGEPSVQGASQWGRDASRCGKKRAAYDGRDVLGNLLGRIHGRAD